MRVSGGAGGWRERSGEGKGLRGDQARVRKGGWALGGRPSGERSGQRPGWAAGLGSLSLTNLYQKRNRERKRKRGLGKDLRMGIIFPDSQKYARSKKNRKAMIERFKFKLI